MRHTIANEVILRVWGTEVVLGNHSSLIAFGGIFANIGPFGLVLFAVQCAFLCAFIAVVYTGNPACVIQNHTIIYVLVVTNCSWEESSSTVEALIENEHVRTKY